MTHHVMQVDKDKFAVMVETLELQMEGKTPKFPVLDNLTTLEEKKDSLYYSLIKTSFHQRFAGLFKITEELFEGEGDHRGIRAEYREQMQFWSVIVSYWTSELNKVSGWYSGDHWQIFNFLLRTFWRINKVFLYVWLNYFMQNICIPPTIGAFHQINGINAMIWGIPFRIENTEKRKEFAFLRELQCYGHCSSLHTSNILGDPDHALKKYIHMPFVSTSNDEPPRPLTYSKFLFNERTNNFFGTYKKPLDPTRNDIDWTASNLYVSGKNLQCQRLFKKSLMSWEVFRPESLYSDYLEFLGFLGMLDAGPSSYQMKNGLTVSRSSSLHFLVEKYNSFFKTFGEFPFGASPIPSNLLKMKQMPNVALLQKFFFPFSSNWNSEKPNSYRDQTFRSRIFRGWANNSMILAQNEVFVFLQQYHSSDESANVVHGLNHNYSSHSSLDHVSENTPTLDIAYQYNAVFDVCNTLLLLTIFGWDIDGFPQFCECFLSEMIPQIYGFYGLDLYNYLNIFWLEHVFFTGQIKMSRAKAIEMIFQPCIFELFVFGFKNIRTRNGKTGVLYNFFREIKLKDGSASFFELVNEKINSCGENDDLIHDIGFIFDLHGGSIDWRTTIFEAFFTVEDTGLIKKVADIRVKKNPTLFYDQDLRDNESIYKGTLYEMMHFFGHMNRFPPVIHFGDGYDYRNFRMFFSFRYDFLLSLADFFLFVAEGNPIRFKQSETIFGFAYVVMSMPLQKKVIIPGQKRGSKREKVLAKLVSTEVLDASPDPSDEDTPDENQPPKILDPAPVENAVYLRNDQTPSEVCNAWRNLTHEKLLAHALASQFPRVPLNPMGIISFEHRYAPYYLNEMFDLLTNSFTYVPKEVNKFYLNVFMNQQLHWCKGQGYIIRTMEEQIIFYRNTSSKFVFLYWDEEMMIPRGFMDDLNRNPKGLVAKKRKSTSSTSTSSKTKKSKNT